MYYNSTFIKTAYDDARFKKETHFIRSDVNAKFLKKHNINMTVAAFKAEIEFINPAFLAEYGNRKYSRLGKVKVWNINTIKKYLESKQALN